MAARSTPLVIFLSLMCVTCVTGRAVAELLTALFPDGVPGYDDGDGVTVTTRLHPDQMPLGVRAGVFSSLPQLSESTGYSSNALPGPYRRGGWEVVTTPQLGIASAWSRESFGALVSVTDTRFAAMPSQNRTDATVSAGGRIDVGDGKLTLAAAHLVKHEDRSDPDSIASDRPIAFTLDDVRASYALSDGPWTIEPNVEAADWRYDATTILGVPASEAYRDRVVVQGGVTLRYALAPLRDVVVMLRTVSQSYTNTPAGQASPDSLGYQLLAGLDYDDDAVWRWRVLVGAESRRFASSAYRRRDTLIAEAGVGWSPSGMTSVNATLSRETGDAAQEGTSGLVVTAARLTIDHEYLRNLLLHAAFGWQMADFFQGGQQSGTSETLGMTWVMNRNTRLSLTYQQTDLHGSGGPAATPVSGYSQGLGLLTLRLGL